MADEWLAEDAAAVLVSVVSRERLQFAVAGGRGKHAPVLDGVQGLQLLGWELLE